MPVDLRGGLGGRGRLPSDPLRVLYLHSYLLGPAAPDSDPVGAFEVAGAQITWKPEGIQKWFAVNLSPSIRRLHARDILRQAFWRMKSCPQDTGWTPMPKLHRHVSTCSSLLIFSCYTLKRITPVAVAYIRGGLQQSDGNGLIISSALSFGAVKTVDDGSCILG